MTEDVEMLKQRMFDIKMKLERISKTTLLTETERKEREIMIKNLNDEYKEVKKAMGKLLFKIKENENAKHKR